MVVKHCCFGTCTSDNRYPERSGDVIFIPFAKPKGNLDRCLAWIKPCGRPHTQLNVDKITKDTYICSKHFPEGKPTTDYPNPVPVNATTIPKSRRSCVRHVPAPVRHVAEPMDADDVSDTFLKNEKCLQTDEILFSSIDMMAEHARIRQLENENEILTIENKQVKHRNKCLRQEIKRMKSSNWQELQTLKEEKASSITFSTKAVRDSKLKNLFHYYTGLTYPIFLCLFSMIMAGINNIQYTENRKDVKQMNTQEQLFLTLCRLRNSFHVKDLALRFNVSPQAVCYF